MKYAIVFNSQTGNTAKLAEVIRETLPAQDCICYGRPELYTGGADMIFAGFWTDKGSCDEEMQAFLSQISNSAVFLFGTAGFGQSSDYFDQILHRVGTCLQSSICIAGTYMCQGKMPFAVRKRYEGMLETDPKKADGLLKNFDQALSHPDEADLALLKQQCRQLTEKGRDHQWN